MKVLIVGGGSREHAITDAFYRSVYEPVIYAISSNANPGILRICKKTGGELIKGNINDPMFVADMAEKLSVDLVFIGPEEPLFHGVPDELEHRGVPVIGLNSKASEIEKSKAFMRRLMWKYKIPGRLRFKAFKSIEDALAYIEEYAESVAIKPARQAGGKGVKVIADIQAYLKKVKEEVKKKHAERIYSQIMARYRDIEDKILIEEKVEGPEYTIQCITDGESVLPFPPVQDNKHAFEMEMGPETGGMGSISGRGNILPFITEEEYKESVKIIEGVVKALRKEVNQDFRGVISGQMMLTMIWGPTIIEFYARFGDPEAVNVLPLLETDMIDICEAILSRKLHKVKLKFRDKATVVKAIAPRGYPNRRDLAKGHPLIIDEKKIKELGGRVFYGSVNLVNGKMLTGGSRAVEIYAEGESIEKAAEIAEKCVRYVRTADGWALFHRSDIGSPISLKRMIELAELVRSVYTYRKSRGILGKYIDWIPGRGKIVYES